MKKHIVTAVDTSDTSDGKARVLNVCNSREEAEAYVRADIEKWADDRAGMPIVVDFDKMSAKYNWETFDDASGCEWNIEEVEIPSPSLESIRKSEQVLVDNGIEEDEAETVLQAIGYTLFDVELYPVSE